MKYIGMSAAIKIIEVHFSDSDYRKEFNPHQLGRILSPAEAQPVVEKVFSNPALTKYHGQITSVEIIYTITIPNEFLKDGIERKDVLAEYNFCAGTYEIIIDGERVERG